MNARSVAARISHSDRKPGESADQSNTHESRATAARPAATVRQRFSPSPFDRSYSARGLAGCSVSAAASSPTGSCEVSYSRVEDR
ncbi:hypothetical protein D3C72_704880 [compost metagenome]